MDDINKFLKEKNIIQEAKEKGFDTETIWYHVTNKSFEDFDTTKSFDGNMWLTRDYDSIVNGETGASLSGENINIYKYFLKLNKVAGWDEEDKYMDSQLEQEGYDGVLLDDDIKIFNPKNAFKIPDYTNKNNTDLKNKTKKRRKL